MSAAQKAQSPLAGGLSAETKADPASIPPSAEARNLEKRRIDAMARLALRGHVTTPVLTGAYFVSRHGLSRYCKNLEELERFAALVGAV